MDETVTKLPRRGKEIHAFKKVLIPSGAGQPWWDEREVIVLLIIPADARRVKAWSDNSLQKCRAEYAEVVGICDLDGTMLDAETVAHSCVWDRSFKYRIGETVIPDGFDTFTDDPCGRGIHFFETWERAVDYSL